MDNFKLFIIFIALVIFTGLVCTYDLTSHKEQTNNSAQVEKTTADNSSPQMNTAAVQSPQKMKKTQPIKNEPVTAESVKSIEGLEDVVIENNTIYIPPLREKNHKEINQSENINNQIMPPLSEEERKKQAEERMREFERRIKEDEERRIREQQKKYDEMEPLPVVLRCDEWNCTLSPDKLTMKYGKAGASSKAIATRHYKKGKYYFEVEYKTLPNPQATAFCNIGIVADKGFRFCNLNYVDEKQRSDRCPAYGIFRFATKLYDGDIIGVAIDLDNGKLSYSINDVWNAGMPSNMPDGIKIQKGLEYAAAFEAGRHVYYNVNFGSKPFKYKIPRGYKAYN